MENFNKLCAFFGTFSFNYGESKETISSSFLSDLKNQETKRETITELIGTGLYYSGFIFGAFFIFLHNQRREEKRWKHIWYSI